MQIQTYHFANYQTNTPPTFVVLGLARGGTSLFAGMLHAMGLFMGDDFVLPNYEDGRLTRAFRSGNRDEINEVVASYNERAASAGWGFKNPALNSLIIKQISTFRNPVILLARKDMSSVARRRAEVYRLPPYASLISTYLAYRWLRWKAMRSGAPVVIVDYAAVTGEPDRWLRQFCQLFSNVPLNMEAALSFINKGNDEYLKWKASWMQRRHKSIVGFVDVIAPYQVAGWVRYKKSNKPLLVEVRLNGKILATSMATVYREDVARSVPGSNGYCGFDFSFDMPLSETELPAVEVCVEGMLLARSAGVKIAEEYSAPHSS